MLPAATTGKLPVYILQNKSAIVKKCKVNWIYIMFITCVYNVSTSKISFVCKCLLSRINFPVLQYDVDNDVDEWLLLVFRCMFITLKPLPFSLLIIIAFTINFYYNYWWQCCKKMDSFLSSCAWQVQFNTALLSCNKNLDLDDFIDRFGRFPQANWNSMSHTAALTYANMK